MKRMEIKCNMNQFYANKTSENIWKGRSLRGRHTEKDPVSFFFNEGSHLFSVEIILAWFLSSVVLGGTQMIQSVRLPEREKLKMSSVYCEISPSSEETIHGSKLVLILFCVSDTEIIHPVVLHLYYLLFFFLKTHQCLSAASFCSWFMDWICIFCSWWQAVTL